MKIKSEELKNFLNLSSTGTLEFDTLGLLLHRNGKKILSYLENENFIAELESNNNIVAVFTTSKLAKKLKNITIIKSTNPKYDFCRFHNFLFKNTDFYKKRITWKSFISKKAIVRSNLLSSEKVFIDEKSLVDYNVVIYQHVKIGKNVKISSNVIIGEEGAELARKKNKILHFHHDGGVIIKDNVSIQSTVSIKRGLFGTNTVIGEGTTIGSFANIGHAVKIGKNCFIAPGTALAGSAIINDNCFFGLNSVVLNGIKIGKNCKIGSGSIVTKDIPENKVVVGIPGKILRENT